MAFRSFFLFLLPDPDRGNMAIWSPLISGIVQTSETHTLAHAHTDAKIHHAY